MQLRDYQQEAVDSFFLEAKNTTATRTLISAPTASGKSLIIAEITRRVVSCPGHNVLILQHRKELIEQNASELQALGCNVALYSAGLGQKNTGTVTLAGIQSIYKSAYRLPSISLAIIDEAHLLSPTDDSMYQRLLKDLLDRNPKLKLLGLTATPYRMKTGSLVDNDSLFSSICYKIPMQRLIREGYLCPVKSKVAKESIDTSDIKLRSGEYILNDAALKFDATKSMAVIREIDRLAPDRKSVLVFCSTVAHAEFFTKLLNQQGKTADYIVADTLLRDQIIKRFKAGEIQYLVNVDTLTTGFNATNIDCLVLLRPTQSPGLYVQCIGRGMRIHPGKKDCLVLDFAGNIERHGPVDLVEIRKKVRRIDGEYIESEEMDKAPVKVCPACLAAIHPRKMTCPECLYEFDPTENHGIKASTKEILSEVVDVAHEVEAVSYSIHKKLNKPPIFKITYELGMAQVVYEYLCFEHGGFASEKAKQIWKRHAVNPSLVPTTSQEALFYAETGELKHVTHIKARTEGKWTKVIAWKYGEKPAQNFNESLLLQESDTFFF